MTAGIVSATGTPFPGNDDAWQFVLGPADEARAEIFLRLRDPSSDERVVVAGECRGPECSVATTLPATTRLVDLGGGGAPTGRGVVTEPSYWTPDHPAVYRIDARATVGGRILATCRRGVGLRRFGARGRSFWLDGRRWVPRGVTLAGPADPAALRELRAITAAVVLDDPSADACQAADVVGTPIVATLDTVVEAGAAAARIRRWTWHPSVLLVVVPTTVAGEAARLRRFAGTLLIGIEADAGLPPPTPPSGIDFLVARMTDGELPHAEWGEAAVPVVARRHTGGDGLSARRACDTLQAELAAWGLGRDGATAGRDWAGYLVG